MIAQPDAKKTHLRLLEYAETITSTWGVEVPRYHFSRLDLSVLPLETGLAISSYLLSIVETHEFDSSTSTIPALFFTVMMSLPDYSLIERLQSPRVKDAAFMSLHPTNYFEWSRLFARWSRRRAGIPRITARYKRISVQGVDVMVNQVSYGASGGCRCQSWENISVCQIDKTILREDSLLSEKALEIGQAYSAAQIADKRKLVFCEGFVDVLFHFYIPPTQRAEGIFMFAGSWTKPSVSLLLYKCALRPNVAIKSPSFHDDLIPFSEYRALL